MAAIPALNDSQALFVLFFLIQTISWVGSVVILLTVTLSSRVHRHITWLNFCLNWILSCLSYLILLFTGEINKDVPNAGICLIQASAIYSAPALTAGSTFSLAVHLWLQFQSRDTTRSEEDFKLRQTVILIATPYVAPVAMSFGVLTYGIQNPSKVILAGSKMYCGINSPVPGKISAIYVAVIMAPTVILKGFIIAAWNRNCRPYYARKGLPIIIRLGAFTCVGFFAVAVSLIYLSSRDYGRLPNVLMSLPPLAFVLIFGSQMDLVNVWMFWRREAKSNTPPLKVRADPAFTQPQADGAKMEGVTARPENSRDGSFSALHAV